MSFNEQYLEINWVCSEDELFEQRRELSVS